MKFSLKEALIKYNLLNEGWVDDLKGKYDDEVINFVIHVLESNYEGEENSSSKISNNLLAPWMAKIVKELGGPSNMGTKELTSTKHAFEIILNYFKSKDNSNQAASEILSKNAKDAFNFAKEELETQHPEDLKEWVDKNYIQILGKGNDGLIWVKVLNKNWFNEVCRNNRIFGIACQTGSETANSYVGGKYETYTLLGKPKNQQSDFYTTLASIATNTSNGSFVEIKQTGNQQPGSVDASGWNKGVLAKEIFKFIAESKELKDINKFVDFFHQNNIPSNAITYGGAGAFAFVLRNYPDIIQDLLRKRPELIEDHESLIRNIKPDFLDLVNINFEDLVITNPNQLVLKFKTYFETKGSEFVDSFSKIDFENYIKTNGTDVLFSNLIEIIEKLPYNFFKEKIYPHINFSNFISTLNQNKLKEVLRVIRNKFDKNINNFLNEFNALFEKDSNAILKILGGGELSKGLAVLQNFIKTPRLNKHQNFETKKGIVYVTVEEPVRDAGGNIILDFNGNRVTEVVTKPLPLDDMILNHKAARDFYKRNEEIIKKVLPGDEQEKEVRFLRYILLNSSEQDRLNLLKKEKEKFVSYYDNKFKEGKTKEPGIFELGKMLKPNSFTEKIFQLSPNVKAYYVEKSDFYPNLKNIIKYFSENSVSNNKKIFTGISGAIATAYLSRITGPDLFKLAEMLTPDKFGLNSLSDYNNYISMLIDFSESNDSPDSITKDMILKISKSPKFIEAYNKTLKEGGQKAAVEERKYRDLISLLEDSNIQEGTVRKYIKSLLDKKLKNIYKK